MEQPRPRCDGCGGNLEPWEDDPVIYDCFHAVHAACGACPRCGTPPDGAGAGAGGAAAPSSPPPDSSVAGSATTSSNDDGCPYARGVVECDDCGGLYRFSETGFWNGNCPHCILRWLNPRPSGPEGHLGSPGWSSSSFGSPLPRRCRLDTHLHRRRTPSNRHRRPSLDRRHHYSSITPTTPACMGRRRSSSSTLIRRANLGARRHPLSRHSVFRFDRRRHWHSGTHTSPTFLPWGRRPPITTAQA
ncbi:unnamed protein product [Urochloa humidicola]